MAIAEQTEVLVEFTKAKWESMDHPVLQGQYRHKSPLCSSAHSVIHLSSQTVHMLPPGFIPSQGSPAAAAGVSTTQQLAMQTHGWN